jgi:F-type H+-transporting ATPase subunit epsilon
MQPFKLKIVTPHGLHFDGEAESLIVRTIAGDAQILAKHVNYVTALGIGRAKVTSEGKSKLAACSNGVLSVINGEVTVLANTFEWSDQIDIDRVNQSLKENKEILESSEDSKEIEVARMKILRDLVRRDVAEQRDKKL